MALLSTAEAIRHLRLVDDYPVDQVEPDLRSAEDHAQSFLGRKVYPDEATMAAAVLAGTAGDDPILLNDEIRAGVRLILGQLFRNRESGMGPASEGYLPMGAYSLLQPYRVSLGV